MSQSATERYKQALVGQQLEIVDVQAPSGFVFKFRKPNKLALLFGAGELPLYVVNQAVESWEKKGLAKPETKEGQDQLKLVEKTLELRDRVFELSHEPKLVPGRVQSETELSTNDVSDEDLRFLLIWVASGGDASAKLANFSARPGSSPVAGASRKKRRHAAK